MKIARFKFPVIGKTAASRRLNKEHWAKRLLEDLDYTPQTARHLARILRQLADESPRKQDDVLDTFSRIVREK